MSALVVSGIAPSLDALARRILVMASINTPTPTISPVPATAGGGSADEASTRWSPKPPDTVGQSPATETASMSEPTPEEQLEELIRDHLDAVYRVAFSVVRDNALAEDVAQDAILKAWRALPTFRGESTLRSWLLRITHNTAISTIRRRREELRDPLLLPENPATTTTEKQVVDSLSADAFEDALDHLDELSRSIVVLREIEGMSYEEISETLEVPLPTVKTRLLRARRTLAGALEGWRP